MLGGERMSPERRQFILRLELALRRQVFASASSNSSPNCSPTISSKQGQLNCHLNSVPNSNSSPSSSSQSQADDSQSEREEQQVDQFLTDESTPCHSPPPTKAIRTINNAINLDINNNTHTQIGVDGKNDSNNCDTTIQMGKLAVSRPDSCQFERASLRRASQRRQIKRSSQRRRSRKTRQVRFEPIPQAIDADKLQRHDDDVQTEFAILRNPGDLSEPQKQQDDQQIHHGIFETNARRRVRELTRGLNKLGNRVNFRKLKLKKFNDIAQNLQQKLNQSRTAIKQSHQQFRTKTLGRRQATMSGNISACSFNSSSRLSSQTANSSPKAASYDLIGACHGANRLGESQFEPVQSGRYGLVCEDQADRFVANGSADAATEDWGSDFDQSEQSDSEERAQASMDEAKRRQQASELADLSLRQLVIDVIDNCEKPNKLSTLTRSVLERSNSLCSNLSSSRDELQSDQSESNSDDKIANNHIKTRLSRVGHHKHLHLDLTKSTNFNTNTIHSSDTNCKLQHQQQVNPTTTITRKRVPNNYQDTDQQMGQATSLYKLHDQEHHSSNLDSTLNTYKTNSTCNIEWSYSSVGTIDGLEHRSLQASSISFEPKQVEPGAIADSTSTKKHQQQYHNVANAKITLKKYFTHGWRELTKLTSKFTTSTSPTNDADPFQAPFAPNNNQSGQQVSPNQQKSYHLGGAPQATSAAFARSDAGLANHFVTLSNRKWKSCHLRSNIMHIALNNHNNVNNISNTGEDGTNNISNYTGPNAKNTSPFSSGRDLAYLDNSKNFIDDDL